MSGEPKTLTTQVWAGRVEALVDKEERVIHKISFELPPGFTFAEPTADGVPVVARDDAAELRAAVRRMAAADAELTVVGEAPRPDVDEWGAKWDAAQREYNAAMLNICQLAATEGSES